MAIGRQIKVKLVPVPAMKAYEGSGGIAQFFLNFGTRRRWVVTYTTRPLYALERASGTHRIGGWVEPRAGLKGLVRENLSTLP
jgi:hypothetical protein